MLHIHVAGFKVLFSHQVMTFCDPMDCSTPGFSVPHHLLEFAQIHVLWIRDAIQPSHPVSPSFPSAFNLSQHQGLFQWVSLPIRWPKYWSFSFNISPSNEYSGLISFRMTGLISLQSKGFLRVFSNTAVQKHQFFGTQLPLFLKFLLFIYFFRKLKEKGREG